MSTEPAYTLAALRQLQHAIVAGTTSVAYDGGAVTYRSLDDMLMIEMIMKRELGLTGPGRGRRRRLVMRLP